MGEPILSDNLEKAPTESNLSITSNHINIELSKEFLVEIKKNIYYETYNEDVVDHTVKEITIWEELVEKFFCRFYPESYDGEDEMLDKGENWGIAPLEFLSNINTSFKNHKKVDGRTQKESKYENPSNTATNSFFKGYEVRDIKKQSQTKHKYSNISKSIKELPNKRRYQDRNALVLPLFYTGPRERNIDELEICTLQMGMYISSQNSCDFTTVTINGESEEQRTIEGIIWHYYDREDGETTLRFEV
ncbi:hypothetical protein Tco_0874833 [Tanacetum coccineum]|uniref:Uncharacterized protein n=1 Tax=Tanacetum coccineum TaxID=301880 RepID=A0ABQ5BQL4_9ASTR